jgi:hypothetical protein
MEFLIYLSSVLIGPQEAAEDKGPTSGLEPLTSSLTSWLLEGSPSTVESAKGPK